MAESSGDIDRNVAVPGQKAEGQTGSGIEALRRLGSAGAAIAEIAEGRRIERERQDAFTQRPTGGSTADAPVPIEDRLTPDELAAMEEHAPETAKIIRDRQRLRDT